MSVLLQFSLACIAGMESVQWLPVPVTITHTFTVQLAKGLLVDDVATQFNAVLLAANAVHSIRLHEFGIMLVGLEAVVFASMRWCIWSV